MLHSGIGAVVIQLVELALGGVKRKGDFEGLFKRLACFIRVANFDVVIAEGVPRLAASGRRRVWSWKWAKAPSMSSFSIKRFIPNPWPIVPSEHVG